MATPTDELTEFHRRNGTLAEYPTLAAHAEEIERAETSMLATLAAKQAEREAKRARETPIVKKLLAVPATASDIAIVITYSGGPYLSVTREAEQVYELRLASGSISFLPREYADALDGRQMSGWFACSVAQLVRVEEILGAQDLSANLGKMTWDSIPWGIVAWRRFINRSGTQHKSFASQIASKLGELGHSVPGSAIVLGTARPEWNAQESAADQVLALAGPIAAPSLADDDPIDRQLNAVNEQANRLLEKQIERANRDALAAGNQ